MTIAFYCVFIAAMIPYGFTAAAKIGAPGFNNYKVRDFQNKLEGWRRRAHWAHQNGMEAFPPFAAGVIIAQTAGAPQGVVDKLAITFVVFRLLYGALYIANKAPLRSVAWFVGFGCMIALFFVG